MNRSDRLVLPLFAAGLLVLQLGWTLSVPAFWGMDEPDHVTRAAAVARGHWLPSTRTARPDSGRGQSVEVPTDVARSVRAPCLARAHVFRDNCVGAPARSPGTVTIDSAAGRYDPAYYAVAGLVARPFHGDGFLFAMRAVTAVLSCALLTAALWSVLTWTRTRWPLVALLLVITPTTLYSSTVAAPNGVHMSAAIALWCALLGLGRGHEERPRFGLLLLMAVASAVTACTHSLGILWVPLIFFVAWYARGAPHVRGLLAAVAPARGWVLAVVLPYLAAAAWVVLARTNSPHDELTQHRAGSPLPSVLAGWLRWPLQTISAAPNRVDGSPTAVYAIWMVGAGLLIWVASRRVLHRREYHAVVVLVALSVVIPSALTCMTFSQLGAAWQGRYGYPLSVGVLLVLATAADRTRRRELPAVLAGLGVALLTLGQVVAQISARDHSAAAPGLVRATHWHPPGTMLFVLCGIVACVLLVRSLAVTAPAARPTPRPASSPATTVA